MSEIEGKGSGAMKRVSAWWKLVVVGLCIGLIACVFAAISMVYRPAPGVEWQTQFEANSRQINVLQGQLDALRADSLQRVEKNAREMMAVLREMSNETAPATSTVASIVEEDSGGVAGKTAADLRKKIENIERHNADLQRQAGERLKSVEPELVRLFGAAKQGSADLSDLRALSAEVRALRQVAEGRATAEVVQDSARTRVAVYPVRPRSIRDVLTLPGDVEAADDIMLAAKNDGVVEWLGAKDGDQVHAGQELVRIDAARLVELVRSADAAARLAEANHGRTKRLYDRKVASEGDLDVARSQYDQAKAALAIARRDLEDASLRSPINGRLDDLIPDVGEFVNRGETVARLVNLSTVKIKLNVPEKDIAFFREKQEARVELPQPPGEYLTGRISRMGLVADSLSRTFVVEVTAENAKDSLLPGMIARVELVRQTREQTVVVPIFVISQTQDGPAAYVAVGGVARMRRVTLGVRQGMEVEVTGGVSVGDRLIVLGQRTLSDGSPVETVREFAEPPSLSDLASALAMAK